MFEDGKAAKLFASVSNLLKPRAREKFTALVKDAFDKKIVSFEDMRTYKITAKEVGDFALRFPPNDYAK